MKSFMDKDFMLHSDTAKRLITGMRPTCRFWITTVT